MVWLFESTENLNPILRASLITLAMTIFFVTFAVISALFVEVANHYTGNGGWGALAIMFLSTFGVNLYFCLDYQKKKLEGEK
tara:strand:+ start:601 stop:846 length:246 start_codon:yes stop_codon:yes gene_type:complete